MNISAKAHSIPHPCVAHLPISILHVFLNIRETAAMRKHKRRWWRELLKKQDPRNLGNKVGHRLQWFLPLVRCLCGSATGSFFGSNRSRMFFPQQFTRSAPFGTILRPKRLTRSGRRAARYSVSVRFASQLDRPHWPSLAERAVGDKGKNKNLGGQGRLSAKNRNRGFFSQGIHYSRSTI